MTDDIEELKSRVVAGQYLHWASNFIMQASMRYCLMDVKKEIRDMADRLTEIADSLREGVKE